MRFDPFFFPEFPFSHFPFEVLRTHVCEVLGTLGKSSLLIFCPDLSQRFDPPDSPFSGGSDTLFFPPMCDWKPPLPAPFLDLTFRFRLNFCPPAHLHVYIPSISFSSSLGSSHPKRHPSIFQDLGLLDHTVIPLPPTHHNARFFPPLFPFLRVSLPTVH